MCVELKVDFMKTNRIIILVRPDISSKTLNHVVQKWKNTDHYGDIH